MMEEVSRRGNEPTQKRNRANALSARVIFFHTSSCLLEQIYQCHIPQITLRMKSRSGASKWPLSYASYLRDLTLIVVPSIEKLTAILYGRVSQKQIYFKVVSALILRKRTFFLHQI